VLLSVCYVALQRVLQLVVLRFRSADQVYATAAQLDEEQHVQPLQPDRLDGQEVDREHAPSMRPNELLPCHPWAGAGRSKSSCPQPGPDRRR
jgi:hypothetical protein